MSGIFGFTYRAASKQIMDDAIGGLRYWNQIYGAVDQSVQCIDFSCIGCFVEHFSDRFPYGGPILNFRGAPAVVDALIYNRDELLPMLSLDEDSSISDEELILTLIDAKGFSALRLVNGDFAGAIYDVSDKEWTLFRDHMGVRQLYYYADQDKIVFGTDLRGIVSVPGVDTGVNSQYLFEYVLGINFLTQTKTEYEHIHCVHPGSILRLRMLDTSVFARQDIYWKPRERKIRLGNDEEYIRRMRELITDAVHRRCDAIPGLLGAELSGGLDSCTIDIILNRHGRDAVYYSWCCSPEQRPLVEGDDERKVIMDVCEQEGITCRYIEPSEELYIMDELNAHMPPYVNTPHLVSGSRWMKSQGTSVVFSGHGGDEGVSHRANPFELLYNLEFLSYFRIYWMYFRGKKLRLPRAIRSGLLDAWIRIKEHFRPAKKEELMLELFTDEFVDHALKASNLHLTPFSYAPHQYVYQGGSRYRLQNCAYMGAYCGVRYLFPYIDHRVMDFAVSIPRRLHVNHKTNRLIFRQAFEDILPKSLRELTYKDMPSIRNTEQTRYRHKQVQKQLAFVLEHLDEEIWGRMLDFNEMRRLCSNDTISNEDSVALCIQTAKLFRFVLTQDIQENAPRWREFDGESI